MAVSKHLTYYVHCHHIPLNISETLWIEDSLHFVMAIGQLYILRMRWRSINSDVKGHKRIINDVINDDNSRRRSEATSETLMRFTTTRL